ncbi:DUF962 domain-containing protein [Oceanicoccus sp. KOV_DT_Chl]|uniref:DUF962 domain-containing protein n=1 Tax=Oceanicoccus sp. KOV_DT_Chl TaxID=1904639 RepID=UPI000C7BF8CB|nr:DUF962 domain-containing protein [Oceanicoccus sp. KOV_DT_Chl]
MKTEFATFSEFYDFYLTQHSHPVCRYLHYLGSTLTLIALLFIVISGLSLLWLLVLPLIGYGCAWVGHFGFEKNRPATFGYPLYSFASDWVMYKDWLLTPLQKPKP